MSHSGDVRQDYDQKAPKSQIVAGSKLMGKFSTSDGLFNGVLCVKCPNVGREGVEIENAAPPDLERRSKERAPCDVETPADRPVSSRRPAADGARRISAALRRCFRASRDDSRGRRGAQIDFCRSARPWRRARISTSHRTSVPFRSIAAPIPKRTSQRLRRSVPTAEKSNPTR